MSSTAEVDHIVMGVADLDAATAALARLGLTALPGGTHPHWGTANRIVPLGAAYLELVAVVDREVAAGSAFGSWVAAQARGVAAWGWAVRPADIAATSQRLGLDPAPGSRVRPDGVTLSWTLAGVPDDGADRTLPFFIAWGDGVPMPGQAPVEHPGGVSVLASVVVRGDAVLLEQWLGGTIDGVHALPVEGAAAGVVEVVVEQVGGPVVLHPDDLR